MTLMFFFKTARNLVQWMNSHPVATSAASGSLTSILFWLARDLVKTDLAPGFASLDLNCPLRDSDLDFWKGFALGILCWPILEALLVIKQWLILVLKQKLLRFCGDKLYKVL